MNPNIKYLYSNFLCKTIGQYVNILAPIFGDYDKRINEIFWDKYKIIDNWCPLSEWRDNKNKGVRRL